jgi:hypothetical protein
MWYESLSPNNREQAKKLFGKINQMAVSDEGDRKDLFKYSVLAFENLKYKQNLEQLDSTSTENAREVARILDDLDDIEATRFHQTVTQRLRVIGKLEEKLADNALETVLQEHLGEHPWLLDPSWERTAGTELMEDWVRIDFSEEEDDAAGRLDLKHVRTAGKHVVIDLKRPEYTVSPDELKSYAEQYRDKLGSLLSRSGRTNEPIEVVFVVGQSPEDVDGEGDRRRPNESLDVDNARVQLYENLLKSSRESYEEYIRNRPEAGRVSRLLNEIDAGETLNDN